VRSLRTSAVRQAASLAVPLIFLSLLARAQAPPSPAADPASREVSANEVRDLQEQVRELRTMVEQMRDESAQSRSEMQQLRQELQSTRGLLERSASLASIQPAPSAGPGAPLPAISSDAHSSATSQAASATPDASALEDRVQKLEESTSLLGSKIDEQYQTKVETASKYRARLSGIILMNAFRNVGTSDNLDFPNTAGPLGPNFTNTSFGATLRQSEIGLEVFGPTVAGARTSANVQLDFAGGFAAVNNGANFGIARLQTAALHFDWAHTSVIAGQDSLFVSPLSPTSFASLAVPTFAYAGNLWGWIPQIRVEHRFELSDAQAITLQAGILDNFSWQPPDDPYFRHAQAGEQDGQPAYGLRTAWSHTVFGRPLSFGTAGYYGRQNWAGNRYLDTWAGMTDWQLPIAPRFTLSGEFYRGRGMGALGAGISRAVVFGGDPGSIWTPLRGLNSAGGWSQLKFQLTPKVEFNGTFAEDNAFAGDIRGFATDANNFGTIIGRNHGALGNVVYRPRSDLLFSAEFRRLHTFPVYTSSSITNQVNLAIGVLF